MQKKKQSQQAAKELWSGAGLSLTARNIADWDFRPVENRLTEIGDTLSQIHWLKRFLFELADAKDRLAAEHIAKLDTPLISDWSDFYYLRFDGFYDFARNRLKKLEQIRLLEEAEAQAQENVKAVKAQSEDPEGEMPPGEWNNRQAALALYALLRAAGMPMGISDREVGKFAELLTIRPSDSMRIAHAKVAGGDYSPKFAKPVAAAFEEIGLTKIASDIRKRFREE